MRAAAFVLSALACAAAAAQSPVYKWKDAAGVTHYSDTPPPSRPAQALRADAPPAGAAPALPYELARAVRNHPVVLYTTAACDGCDQGRALLRARGVPFSEKTVTTVQDRDHLRRAGGDDDALPLLLVGSRKVAGYQAAAWQEALDVAAYPRRTMLPAGYRTGAAAPAAAAVAPPAEAAADAPARQSPPPQQRRQAPPGFQF